MYKIEKKMVETTVLVARFCDICGRDIGPTSEDEMDAQEAITIQFRGGYGSIFGDDILWTVDLCQHCLQKRLGDVLKPDPSNYVEGETGPG